MHPGADDPLVPFTAVSAFAEEMIKAGADWQVISYGGTKHSFTNPQSAVLNNPALGYSRRTDERSWKSMISFFEEIFV